MASALAAANAAAEVGDASSALHSTYMHVYVSSQHYLYMTRVKIQLVLVVYIQA